MTRQHSSENAELNVTAMLDMAFQLLAFFVPVSYTHLDVYKRQATSGGTGMVSGGGRLQRVRPCVSHSAQPRSAAHATKCQFPRYPGVTPERPNRARKPDPSQAWSLPPPNSMVAASTVSYTHLDVYKRQVS